MLDVAILVAEALVVVSVVLVLLSSARLLRGWRPASNRKGEPYARWASLIFAITASILLLGRSSIGHIKPDLGTLIIFGLPVALIGLTFAVSRFKIRPVLEGLVTCLLALQAGIGMSGYGLYFLPSAIAMLVATVLSLVVADDTTTLR